MFAKAHSSLLLGRRSGSAGIVRVLRHWVARTQQRRELLALDQRRLNDIGLTRADAVRESTKHFWQD